MSINNFYIYRHIRPDTNEVFYIGKGNNADNRIGKYARAKCKNRRHDFWKRVVNKNGGKFKVEIIYECATEQEANNKECEFISLYGRKDLGTGTLVNFTDGGEGAKGVVMTEEIRQKHSASMRGDKNWQSKKVINVNSGKIYLTVKQAEKELGMKRGLLGKYLNGNNANKTELIYLDEYNSLPKEKIVSKILQNRIHNKTCSKKVIDTTTNKIYPSLISACNDIGRGYKRVSQMMAGSVKNTTTLKYI